jgi:hypothetical protein
VGKTQTIHKIAVKYWTIKYYILPMSNSTMKITQNLLKVGYDYKFFFPIYQCLIFFDLPFAKIDEEA